VNGKFYKMGASPKACIVVHETKLLKGHCPNPPNFHNNSAETILVVMLTLEGILKVLIAPEIHLKNWE
jgi:hypothetical protein